MGEKFRIISIALTLILSSLAMNAQVITGGIWSVINEFKLIDNQKQLNEHLCLKFTPTSIAITF